MLVHYLRAEARLSKTFEEIAPGTYREESYPYTSKFTSIERTVTTTEEFALTTVAAANEGLCLLKGILDQPLKNESRAGHTNSSSSTEWLCLDVDVLITDVSHREFLEALDPAFKGVSFLFQYSASQGIKTQNGWRGHFFVRLTEPVAPQSLKAWLVHKNFDSPLFQDHLALSASGGALRFPLDVTTCQNDKLIYIAPPTCIGFEDPISERFHFIRDTNDAVQLDFSHISAAKNEENKKKAIAKLRQSQGLPEKKFKTTNHYGTEILTNPDPVVVTGKKEARDFVYLNLNGGDSWAYFFPTSNPEILYNFKGEPCMYMQDVDKDIYNEYSNQEQTTAGSTPFCFLWPDDDQYYRGFANPKTQTLDWLMPTGSKGKLRDFLVQNNVQIPSNWAVDEWQLEFDPSQDAYADFNRKRVNTYRKTEFIRNARQTTAGIPPTIDRVLTSVCVDEATKLHFINWIACIFQTRIKTNTAWIFQGVQGTGKGVLFSRVLVPLLGHQYCHEMTMDRLDDNFNAYLAENILLFIDEAKISDSKDGDRLLNRIKNLITEPEQHIRAMRTNAVTRRSYTNIILASNYDEIIPLDTSDRRFNVAPRQEVPLQLEYSDIVCIAQELPDMANFLHSVDADRERASQVLCSDARAKLIKLSETTVDSFFLAIRSGDLDYFIQFLSSGPKADTEGLRAHDYGLVVRRWVDNANGLLNVSRDELRTAYQYLQNVNISATKFSRMMAKYNISVEPVRVDGELTRGIPNHVWHLDADQAEALREDPKSNVVRFNSHKNSE